MTPNSHKASGTMVSFRSSKSVFLVAWWRQNPQPPMRINGRPAASLPGRAGCKAAALAVAPKTPDSLSGGQVMTRVFLAGIFHETHSFTGTITGLDGFVIHRGPEILKRRGDASQVDGF